jgi:cytochrome c-type biogenesis protein CcmE
VYVKTAQGTDVKVSTSDSTTVGVTQQGKLADLKPGATVVVQGQAGSDGTVTAQAITQEAAR